MTAHYAGDLAAYFFVGVFMGAVVLAILLALVHWGWKRYE